MLKQISQIKVSTHSRPKAAGNDRRRIRRYTISFNTQPPEGGWIGHLWNAKKIECFNTQPPEGGWVFQTSSNIHILWFQHTAARRRLVLCLWHKHQQMLFQHTAARRRLGFFQAGVAKQKIVSTHSRPKAAGPFVAIRQSIYLVSTHSRPKAAGTFFEDWSLIETVSTHSRPKAAGASLKSLALSGFSNPISLNSQEKQKCEYNTAFSVTPAFAIS